MTPHSRPPDHPDTTHRPQARIDTVPVVPNVRPPAGASPAPATRHPGATGGVTGAGPIGGVAGVGPIGGVAAAGRTGGVAAAGPIGGASAAGPLGGVVPGLVQRVQRRLVSAGSVAADPDGLRRAVVGALGEEGIVLPAASFVATVRAIGDELTGLGPLAPLLADPTVTDVLVNGPSDVWVERDGGIERAAVRFPSAAAVAALVQRVVAPLGLRVDEARPWVDARLPGGERFHAVLPPLAPDGPVVTIRTFARRRLDLHDLIERDTVDAVTARLLEAMVAAGVAIAVSGATGTGKTTLLIVSERHPTGLPRAVTPGGSAVTARQGTRSLPAADRCVPGRCHGRASLRACQGWVQ
jgi:pilus assembly protein CpaF